MTSYLELTLKIMWLVKLVTLIEQHPYLFLALTLFAASVIRFFRKEHLRPSYKEQQDLKQLLDGLENGPEKKYDTPGAS